MKNIVVFEYRPTTKSNTRRIRCTIDNYPFKPGLGDVSLLPFKEEDWEEFIFGNVVRVAHDPNYQLMNGVCRIVCEVEVGPIDFSEAWVKLKAVKKSKSAGDHWVYWDFYEA